jgi:ABC-type sugar transport system ATPase subunit
MSPFALELRAITKDFPGVRALQVVTLRVRPGEIHALVGENGAGKSTLMKILNGVYPHGSFEGEILVRGEPARFDSPHDAQEQGIGLVPQEIQVLEGLTVAENIFVGRWTGGPFVNFRQMHARAEAVLRQIGSPFQADQMVATLGASERQLVMIARALAANPAVLVLDEPTSALTHGEAAYLFQIMRQLRADGRTIIFISHKLDEIGALADRSTVLRDGQIAAEFGPGEFDRAALIAAMVGRKMENLFPKRDSVPGPEEVLRVEGLTVPHAHRAHRNVVEGVSFSLRRGEILGLAGLVGSGRSEIVGALYGRVPCRGRVFVGGQAVRVTSPRAAKKAGIGLVAEERKKQGLLFNLGLRENISINSLDQVSRGGWVDRRRERRLAAGFFSRLGIRAAGLETRVGQLSGGNQQKVVLAKVLSAHPRVLLLDEPTKGIDVGAKLEIYKLMLDLVREGVAIIFISSELPELMAMSDRFLVLAAGRVRDEFVQAEASEQRLMAAATVS